MSTLTTVKSLTADLAHVTHRTLQVRGWESGDGTMWFRVVAVDPGTLSDSWVFGPRKYTLTELEGALTFALAVARVILGPEAYDQRERKERYDDVR